MEALDARLVTQSTAAAVVLALRVTRATGRLVLVSPGRRYRRRLLLPQLVHSRGCLIAAPLLGAPNLLLIRRSRPAAATNGYAPTVTSGFTLNSHHPSSSCLINDRALQSLERVVADPPWRHPPQVALAGRRLRHLGVRLDGLRDQHEERIRLALRDHLRIAHVEQARAYGKSSAPSRVVQGRASSLRW